MKNIYKKIISATLLVSMVFSFVFIAAPKRAEATIPVTDVGNAPTHVLTSVSTHLSGASLLGINLKDLTLDKIATAIAKAILQKLTMDVISWINSGFKGSPAFVQNPGSFFANIGDQILGGLIASNGDLKFLCSPFNIDVRLALALNRTSFYNQYTCTLSDIIKNSKNAVKGASINGFTAGDFKQGGWPAFSHVTTQPQNTPNGAYLAAQADLDVRIGNKTIIKKDQLTQGSGFLSWETCTDIPQPGDKNYVGPALAHPTNTTGSLLNGGSSNSGDFSYSNNAVFGASPSPTQITTSAVRPQTCSTQTPGSVISATLNKHLAVPTEELELANDINAIINAAFSQLITIALDKGLAAVTSDSAAGGKSLSSQLNDLNSAQNQQQFASLQSTLLNSASSMAPYANRVKAARDQELALELSTKNTLQSALNCYTTAANSLDVNVLGQAAYDSTLATYNTQISDIQSIIATQITPIDASIMAQDTAATQAVQYVNDIQTRAQNATSTESLNIPNQELLNLAQSQGIPAEDTATKAEQDLAALNTTLDPVLTDAQNRLQACPANNVGTGTATTTGN